MSSLSDKVKQSITLLRTIGQQPVEVSYSGGKDSDVILRLAQMAGLNYRAIYKMTTIDPPHTLAHVRANGADVLKPKQTFFQLIEHHGFPTRRCRFCCSDLKEYKIMDTAIQGIRRCESQKRSLLYREPVICRMYSNNTANHVNVYLPILDWSDLDIMAFIIAEGIQVHPLYYDQWGTLHVERRLGCLCCPLQGDNGRADFLQYPRMVRAWIQAAQMWWSRPRKKELQSVRKFDSVYDLFFHNVFCRSYAEYQYRTSGLFGKSDCRQMLSDYFNIEL